MPFVERQFGIQVLALLALSSLCGPAFAAGALLSPQGFTFQGRLYDAGGVNPLLDTVDLTLGIYAPNGTCLLYEEKHTGIDLSATAGIFAVQVGSAVGDGKRVGGSDPGLAMAKIFANGSGQIRAVGSAGCASGYTPTAGDSRRLRVTVTPQAGIPVTLSPDQTILAAPQATVAETVQGLGPDSLIQVTTNVTQANLETLTGTGGASSLHHHDDLYLKLSTASAQYLGTGVTYTNGMFGIGTSSPTADLSFGGNASRLIQSERHTTPNSAGSTLTLAAGGATAGAADKNGGALVLSSGTSTGSGDSSIVFQTSSAGSSGTADNSPTSKMVLTGSGRVGIGTTSPAAGTILELFGTGQNSSFLIPRDTTANRPATPVNGMMRYNSTTNKFEAYEGGSWKDMISAAGGGGTVTEITAGTGLTGGTINSSGTIAVDVGTAANKIVQLDASAKLPAVDGSALTSLNASNISSGTINASRLPTASSTTTGALSSTDWNTFNSKENALTFSGPLARSTNTISITQATSVADGYLSSGDWLTFNGAASATSAATNANTASTIVKRDASGNFSAGTISATFSGDGSALTTLNASNLSSGTVAAARMPAFTGDVTTSAGSTSTTIANGAVTAAKLGSDVGFWTVDSGNVYRSSGSVGIGTTTPDHLLSLQGAAQTISNTSYDNLNAWNAPALLLRRAGGTPGAPSNPASGFNLGTLAFQGYESGIGSWLDGAQISAVGETPGWNKMPTALEFKTRGSADGVPYLRMRISGDGNVGIGTSSPQGLLDLRQSANNTDVLYSQRFTDTSSTGNFIRLRNAAATTDYFKLDTLGKLTLTPPAMPAGSSGLINSTLPPGGSVEVQALDVTYVSAAGDNGRSSTGLQTHFTSNSPVNNLDFYGLKNTFSLGPTGTTLNAYGVRTDLNSALATGTSYGEYITSNASSTAGTMYGVYVDLSAGTATKKAAVFLGGNVGIGTASPSSQFEVHGTSDGTTPLIKAVNTGSTAWMAAFDANSPNMAANQYFGIAFGKAQSTNDKAGIDYYHAGDGSVSNRISFGFVNNDNLMNIVAAGRVGIGTTSPEGILDVRGGTAASGNGTSINLQAQNGEAAGNTDGGHIILTPGQANGTGQPGAVAIGPTAPPAYVAQDGLYVSSNIYTGLNATVGTTGGNGAYNFGDGSSYIDGTGSSSAADFITFWTQTTERMKIDSSGKVGIGTSTPSYTLDVTGNFRVSGQAYTDTGNATFTNTSDARLKDVHGSYERGLDDILKVETVRYNYKRNNPMGSDSSREYIGVIAQDLQKAIPEAVVELRDGYLGVNSSPVLWTLVNAVKDLYARFTDRSAAEDREIASLKAEVKTLEAENAAIKAYLCAKDPQAPLCK